MSLPSAEDGYPGALGVLFGPGPWVKVTHSLRISCRLPARGSLPKEERSIECDDYVWTCLDLDCYWVETSNKHSQMNHLTSQRDPILDHESEQRHLTDSARSGNLIESR